MRSLTMLAIGAGSLALLTACDPDSTAQRSGATPDAAPVEKVAEK